MAIGKVRASHHYLERREPTNVFLLDGLNIIWPHFLNGCNITRPTDEWLLRAGEWEHNGLEPASGEGPYDTIPHVLGTLTKKK